eukprot:8594878-Pyramimonas_sp.AAC.1
MRAWMRRRLCRLRPPRTRAKIWTAFFGRVATAHGARDAHPRKVDPRKANPIDQRPDLQPAT